MIGHVIAKNIIAKNVAISFVQEQHDSSSYAPIKIKEEKCETIQGN